MPFSLNLPFQLCYPMTLAARRRASRPPASRSDQAAYFDYQYQSSQWMHQRFMNGVVMEGKTVLDIGSGLGGRAPFWIERGAKDVLCIEINTQELAAGRDILSRKFPHLKDRVQFLHPDELTRGSVGDVAILFDVFEHLVEPLAVLNACHRWLRPGGILWSGSIGWYHYTGSHCLGHVPIPWCQMLFSEKAIIRTIRAIVHSPGYVPNVWEELEGIDRWDKVETLRCRPGEPLNMLSLRRIRPILRSTPFELVEFKVHGFSGKANPLAKIVRGFSRMPGLREVFHSYYTFILRKSNSQAG